MRAVWRATRVASADRSRGYLSDLDRWSRGDRVDGAFRVELERVDGYEFRATFPGADHDVIVVDEPPPLGKDSGPNAARVLAVAVGNCLSASLLLCLQKSRVEVHELRTSIEGTLAKNEQGRWRIERLRVSIHAPGVPEDKLARCRALFEDYCIVTQSVRAGLKVDVEVKT